MSEENKRDFDAEAATWDEKPERVRLAAQVTTAIASSIPISKEMKALDYGCGSGLVTLGLLPLLGQITGADSSKGMLDVLARKALDRGLNNVSVLHIQSGEALDGLEGNFDLIVSSMTMHHIEDVPSLIGNLVRLLSHGGWLALADLEAEDGSFHSDPTGVFHHGFERDFLREALQTNGLKFVDVVAAATIEKPQTNGAIRSYPVVLALGKKDS